MMKLSLSKRGLNLKKQNKEYEGIPKNTWYNTLHFNRTVSQYLTGAHDVYSLRNRWLQDP
jgi:hypothetical protein